MTDQPNIHPPAEPSDTVVLGEAIDYLEHLHARMADRVVRVTLRDSDLTERLPRQLKALQRRLADETLKVAQDNATE